MIPQIRVSILDDHQGIIDGYHHRLGNEPDIVVVGTATYGEALEAMLAAHPTDVLLLDVNVPTSEENFNPYPILFMIPKLLETYPTLAVLVISMFNDRELIQAVMDAGSSGYILKDDRKTIEELDAVLRSVAKGGIYFSTRAYQQLHKPRPGEESYQLTPRQAQVLSLCLAYPDRSTADLAKELKLSNSTVRNLLSSSYMRLGVQSRTAATSKARELGLITPFTRPLNPDELR